MNAAAAPGRAGPLLVALALVLQGAVACGERPPPDDRPDILLIVADTLRADYLGHAGFEGPISPHLDRLAGESIRFSDCQAPAPWTKPSVASLMTSLDPDQHGMTRADDFAWQLGDGVAMTQRLSERARTLAEVLRDAGYRTSARVANPWLTERTGFAQGFDDWREVSMGGTGSASEVLAALEQLEGDRPFFLYLHYMEVHGPYGGYPGSEALYAALRRSAGLGRDVVITPAQAELRPSYLGENLRFHRPADAAHLNAWKAAYALGVATLDQQLGELFDGLRRDGRLDEMIVVFTSDHGEEFLEHGVWEHGHTLCGHQLRVPLLLRLPGERRTARVEPALVRTIDVMPTLLGLAGLAGAAERAEGRDLSDRLLGGETVPARLARASGVKGRPGLRSVRGPRYKLVEDSESGRREFFDLASDPREASPLAAAPPAVTTALLAALAGRGDPAATLAEDVAAPLDSEPRRALEALGYLEPETAASATGP